MDDQEDTGQENSAQDEAQRAPLDPAPGLYPDVPEDRYHAALGVSVSKLKLFSECPAKVTAARKETPALRFGSLAHTAILEPGLLDARFFPVKLPRFNPKDSAYKAAKAEAGTRELVKQAEWDSALKLRDTIHGHPTLREMLAPQGLIVEASFWWTDPATGLKCRGRADGLRDDWGVVLDLKSTDSAHPDDFARKVADYHYHWQNAHYENGLAATWRRPERFFFIAVEKEEPWLTAIYELDPRAVEVGRSAVADNLRRWQACEDAGHFPGYPETPQPLNLPAWAYARVA